MKRQLFDFKFCFGSFFSLILLSMLLLVQPAFSANLKLLILGSESSAPQKSGIVGKKTPSNRADPEPVETIVVSLSNEQVQRLIEALSQQPEQEATAGDEEKAGGLVRFIKRIHHTANTARERFSYLKSGMGDDPKDLPQLYRLLSKDESKKKADPLDTIFSVILLFAASHAFLWIYRRFSANIHRRIENHLSVGWKTKIGGLFLRALVRFATMCVSVLITLVLFFVFMDRTEAQSVLVATYLTAFLIVMGVRLISRFFFSPKVLKLRILPITNEAARYLYRWIMVIAATGSFGWLTCGVLRIAGAGEGNYLMTIAAVDLMIIAMIITMIWQKRHEVRQTLSKNRSEAGLLSWIIRHWHYPAILGALLLWSLSTANLLFFGIRPGAPGIKTLLIIPLYFLLDWGLRVILRVVFGIAEKSKPTTQALSTEASNDDASYTELSSEKTEFPKYSETLDDGKKPEAVTASAAEEPMIKKYLNVQRLNRIVGGGLRIVLAAFVFFFLLDIWGFDIKIGKAVARTAFNILIAVLICYVTWEVISTAIQRRLQQEIPEDEEQREEGSRGGSRIGTLLLLLRKFMLAVIVVMAAMIILSSIGVNIGPLIAGAGVIGLAIGFGAQTLVKDIISGLFFLIDDAIRVGDYVETAGTRGMVEHISLRSLRIRHPRGMVHTIPFGDMGSVTNYSRDYIITKLDIRVRYEADIKKIKKIVEKIDAKIQENEEFAEGLMGPIKSQGVRQMDDSAMIVRVKYKTIPGKQFIIRREVYRLIQKEFKANNIEFAHRNVTVYMPPGEPGGALGEKRIEAGAAAAIAAEQAEAQQNKS